MTTNTRLVRTRDGERALLATTLGTADSLITRTKGLLGRDSLPAGEALWIKRCNSIHTFFMRFAIDAIFVDDNLKVVSVYKNLKPWRITRLHFRASSVFELPSGTLNGEIEAGDAMSVESGGGNG
jgi:uncharacterized protein